MVEAVILTTVVEVELWELEMSNTVWTKKAVSTGELGLEGWVGVKTYLLCCEPEFYISFIQQHISVLMWPKKQPLFNFYFNQVKVD